MSKPGTASREGPFGPVSRADLAWALGELGEHGLATMAALSGFSEHPPAPLVEEASPPIRQIGEELAPTPVPEAFTRVPFWRLTSVKHLAEAASPQESRLEPLSARDVGPLGQLGELSVEGLAGWPAIHRLLLSGLLSTVSGLRIDLPRLVHLWSQGRLVDRLPRLPATAWSPRLTVLCDRHLRLAPVQEDQTELLFRLLATMGEAAVSLYLRLPETPFGWTDAASWRLAELPAVEPGEPVLALSDLGMSSSDAAESEEWEEIGRRLLAAGARPMALVPLPAWRWRRSTSSVWSMFEWSSGPGTDRGRSRESTGARAARQRETLLSYLSLAVRVEPGLLREMRRLLPEADVGTELDVWSTLAATGLSVVAARLGRPLAERLRPSWAGLPEEDRASTLRVLRRWHGSLAREIWYEEVLSAEALKALPPGFEQDLSDARDFALRLAATHRATGPVDGELLRESKSWLLRFSQRVPGEIWQDSELGPALVPVVLQALKESGSKSLPAGFPLRWAAGDGPPKRWVLWQVGEQLRLRLEGDLGPPGERGAPLCNLLAVSEVAIVVEPSGRPENLELGPEGAACPLPSGPFILQTDRQELHLTRYQREEWANAGAGRDKYGLWAAFEVEGVEHRFRWIPPGRFWMGSPESEQGRWEDEGPRHLVTLTEGFWLGEAPVTQALWQVVMGENPSYFVSPDRPAEQVSWEQCQDFLQRLAGKEEAKHLGARLPWEAEWEYACRAGTETSIWAGDAEIGGKNNSPLLGTIAWYGGNSGVDFELDKGVDSSGWEEKQYNHTKAGSHPVKHRPANPWGLYDMLGNVWEWCQDYGEHGHKYEPETVPYPRGPGVGSQRVARGGSWRSLARIARAASRGWASPGPHDDVGFRIARSPGAQPVGGAPKPARESRGREAAASGEAPGNQVTRRMGGPRNRNTGIRRVPGDQDPRK